MKIKIRYLGSLSLLAGKDEEVIDLETEKITLRNLLVDLVKRYDKLSRAIDPGGRIRPGYLLFVNEIDYHIVGLEYILREGDEIVIMPISHGGEKEILEIINRFNELYAKCTARYYRVKSWKEDIWKKLYEIYSGQKIFFQVFRSSCAPSKRILVNSLAKSLEATRRSERISRDINIEILLSLANSRDIKTSIKKLGAENGKEAIISLILCDETNFESPERFIEGIEEVTPSKHMIRDWLINLSHVLGANTSICDQITDIDTQINCLEICLLNKISVPDIY
ncbi:MAG: KEOPS complex subunit Cgi121 [Sulfolobales archaeon]